MQHSSGEMARGVRGVRLPDPPRSNPITLEMDSGENEGFGVLPDHDSVSISNEGEILPSQLRGGGASPPLRRFAGESLTVGFQYPMDSVPPISPSAPFSQMNLSDGSISPMIPGLSLGAVEEEDEYYIFPPPDSDNRGSMGDIFGMDMDLTGREDDLEDLPSIEPMPDFDQDILENGKESTKDLQFTIDLSPSPVLRRYTDGASIDKTIWRGHENQYLEVFSASLGYDRPHSSLPDSSTYPESFSSPLKPPTTSESSTSRKRRRSSAASPCVYCITPDKPKEGQKRFLQSLPVELLLLIFEFAYLSPIKFPKCEHKNPKPGPSAKTGPLTRRATANSYFSHHSGIQPQAASETLSSSSTPEVGAGIGASSSISHDDPPRLSDSLRIYRAKTLLYIALTCRQFNNILSDNYIDETFWRSAARWCWDWLPGRLADVQGSEISHQTSWRNLVGVFMRSENGLFRQKGGGKGGVESFGGSKGYTPARLWKDEQTRYKLEKEGTESKRRRRRKLLMVCAQPGPNLFHVTQEGENEYTISLSLKGGADYFITLDEYGRFGKKPARLPGGLKRSERGMGCFPLDIFEVEGERFQLVKIYRGRDRSPPTSTPSPSTNYRTTKPPHHPKPVVKEIVTWDLHCIDEYVSDPKASVARCASSDGWLVCNLFTHRDHDESNIELLLDPPEDPRLFCVQSFGYPGCRPSSRADTTSGEETMSAKRRGKMRESDSVNAPPPDTAEPTTLFRWRREFEYPRAADFQPSLHLHYVLCNLKVNATKAVALIRWNVRTATSVEELVDRQFQVLDLKTGATLQVLQFPNLYWDHRHHDMSVGYNERRYMKMSRLYNYMGPDESMGAGNRCTRIHEDNFILTENDKLISGSHDYCNWVWDLTSTTVQDYSNCVFNAERNDAGVADPFTVLDDFYWEEEQAGGRATHSDKENWNTRNERAGWWIRTPNQIMCFWHGVSGSKDGRYFAACRPGRMFVWDLAAKRNTVVGYQNCEDSSNDNKYSRWLGKLAAHAGILKHRLRNWFVWEDVLPEEGLWLLFEDMEAVYLDRDDVLVACGLQNGKRTWQFERDDFTFDEDDGGDGGRKRRQSEEVASEEEEDENEYDDEEEEDRPFGGIKRVRTTSSFGDDEELELAPGVIPFRFSLEKEMEYD